MKTKLGDVAPSCKCLSRDWNRSDIWVLALAKIIQQLARSHLLVPQFKPRLVPTVLLDDDCAKTTLDRLEVLSSGKVDDFAVAVEIKRAVVCAAVVVQFDGNGGLTEVPGEGGCVERLPCGVPGDTERD